jgi:hypothetical protein
MTDYRAYLLDEQGHVLSGFDFDAATDEAALQHARRYVDGHDVEVWQRGRVVGQLKRGSRGQ